MNNHPEPWVATHAVNTPSDAFSCIKDANGEIVIYEQCNEDELPKIVETHLFIVNRVNACAGMENPHLRLGVLRYWISKWRACDRALQKELIRNRGESPEDAALLAAELTDKEMPL